MSTIPSREIWNQFSILARSPSVLVIEHLGDPVSGVEPPSTLGTPAGRVKRRAAAHAYCKEPQRLVGPPITKFAYAKVFNKGTRLLCSREFG
jgi:hypothetical protein